MKTDTPLKDAISLLGSYHRLVVVNEKNELVNVLSQGVMLKYICENVIV